MAFAYKNLNWDVGKDNIPGIYPEVVYIRKSEISAFPDLIADPQNPTEASTYQGDFSLATDATWKKLFVDVDKSPVTSEVQGEKYAKSYLNSGTFKYPGTHEEATAFCRFASNDDLVFLIQEKSSGKWRVLGNEMFQCDVSPSHAIGGAPTDDRGVTIEVSITDRMPAPYYTGAIETDEGDINPSS